MRAAHPSEINGDWGRASAWPTVQADDGLYRYVPVPPVAYDEDGYPIEDGMLQNVNHLTQTSLWFHGLRRHLPGAMVGSDLPMPYRLGDTTRVLVPDLFVALGSPHDDELLSYRLWEHPLPDVVIEMLSPTTWTADVGRKRRTYEHLGVREYWIFDPSALYSATPLIGFRLLDSRYQRIRADAAGRWPSQVLGLDLHVREGWLRFRNPATGKDLSTYNEAEDRADVAERREAEERSARQAAELREANERSARQAAERETARLRTRLAELGKFANSRPTEP